MSINLLKMLQDQMGDSVVDQASKFLGENSSVTKSGIGSLLPMLLGGVINKGTSESGASGILDMITKGNHDGGILDNLGGLFGGGSSTSNFMNAGSLITSALFGGSKLGSVLDIVTRVTGMRRSSSSSLMNLLAPMVMGMIGRQVKKNGLSASGLMDMLSGQKEHIQAGMSGDLMNALGWAKTSNVGAKVTETVKSTAGKTVETARTAGREVVEETTSSGGGLFKWAVPLLLLLGVGYWLFNKGGSDAVSNVAGDAVETVGDAAGTVGDAATKTVNAAGEVAGGTVDAAGNAINKVGDAAGNAVGTATDAAGNAMNKAGDMAKGAAGAVGGAASAGWDKIAEAAKAKGWSHTVDASGNLVDVKTGNVVAKAGAWSKNASGQVVDASGKAISGVSKFGEAIKNAMNKAGDKIGDAAKATGSAISGAASKAKEKFAGAFKSKATTPIAFSNIDWDGGKIKNFDKEEFVGLAEALKANPGTKITIESFGDKKAVAGVRANWVKTMLQNLGVDAGQIKAKGMVEKGKNATQMVLSN